MTMGEKDFNELIKTISADEKGEADTWGIIDLEKVLDAHNSQDFSHEQLNIVYNKLLAFNYKLKGTREQKYHSIKTAISGIVRALHLAGKI